MTKSTVFQDGWIAGWFRHLPSFFDRRLKSLQHEPNLVNTPPAKVGGVFTAKVATQITGCV
jgi:hypothetical protein